MGFQPFPLRVYGDIATIDLSGYTFANVPWQGAGTINYDLAFFYDGLPEGSKTLAFLAIRQFTIDLGHPASAPGVALVAATANADFVVSIAGGATLGTVHFAAAGMVGTMVSPAPPTLILPGVVIQVVAPAVPDATLANIAITLYGIQK